MLSRPAVANSETGQPSAFGNTSVRGPGQNVSASFFARNEKRANAKAAAALVTWAISGLNRGRPFAAYSRAIASPFVASAPSP